MRNLGMRFVLTFLLALLGGACENSITPTEVLVSIGSDLTVADQLQRVDVEVYAGDGTGLMLHSASFPLAAPGGQGLSLPLSFSVVPSTQRDTRNFRVVVTGIGSLTPGAALGAVVEKQVVAAFQPSTQIRLEVFLSRLCLGKLCRDAAGRRGDLTCNAAGECDAVPVKSEPDAATADAAASDSGALSDAAVDAGIEAGPSEAGPMDGAADAPTTPVDASGADADTGPPLPTAECDATHACNPGYACVQDKCVSKCTQTQCDLNATCSIMAGAPVCTCGSGYIQMLSGTGVVTCAPDVSCAQLACDTTNGSCIVNTDQTRACQCKPGYTGNGQSCAPVDCGAASLTNGTATATNGITTYGGSVNYACNTGYTRSGAASAMCGTDAKWSATATCTPVDCGTPSLLDGMATLTGTTTSFGSGARFICNTGYTPTGTMTATCGANRAWSPKPTCSIVTCSPALAAPTRGSISLSDGNNYGSVASYSCTNSTLQGNQTRNCQTSGTWSGTDPTCLFCGDGRTISEACDPTDQPTWSAWTCTPQCAKRTHYATCSGNTGSGTSTQGIGCDPGQWCFYGMCGLYPCVGDASCPASPAGAGIARCSNNSICIIASCASAADCAPGLTCRLDANPPFCMGCGPSVPCPAGKTCNLYIGESFGRCD
jgi:hypothetical protein